jgi:hypothetical protein
VDEIRAATRVSEQQDGERRSFGELGFPGRADVHKSHVENAENTLMTRSFFTRALEITRTSFIIWWW